MGFLKSLFKSGISEKPEDYRKIYFRWEFDGQEYGPLFFDDMLTRNWSKPPIEGRFENEKKWYKYDYFMGILDNLRASQNQLNTLIKYNISVDEDNLKFREALLLIEKREEELISQRAAEKKEKEKLPATKNTIKKLESYGIKYSANVTRSEAKILLSKYQEKETLKQIVCDFEKRAINISDKFENEVAFSESADNISFVELLEELNDLFKKLSAFNVEYFLPEKLNAKLVSGINNKIESALFDAEDAKEQIMDRNFSTLEANYKIIGKLPQNNFINFNKEIIESHLRGNWDFERDILKLLKTHFPEIKLEREE